MQKLYFFAVNHKNRKAVDLMSESERNEALDKEYDSVFSGEERITNMLKLTSDAFTREYRTIKISEIGITDPVKQGRKNTLTGLSGTVKEMGVLQPIHVMTVEKEVEDDDYKYILLDGLRRIFAAKRNGSDEIDAIVWDFKDKDYGIDNALTISCLLNNNKRRKWEEIWNLYQVLELQKSVSPGTIETLLQLEAGDAMKLKDVMLSDYDEVKGALIDGTKDLEGCYKMLTKLRKEEDSLAKEDETGISDMVEDTEEMVSQDKEKPMLSEEDTKELLDLVDNIDEDNLEDMDFQEMNQSEFEDEHQKVGERHPVDKAIKQGTFMRDNYRCRCCGTGGSAFLATLVYHHAIPVHCGGADTIENGLTLCDSCHQTLHCAEKAGGKIPMTKEQFEEYDEATQKRIKLIVSYAQIAVKAAKAKGISQKKIIEEANKSARHRMPGEDLKEVSEGFARAEQSKRLGETNEEENEE